MQSFFGGADCAAVANPLKQVAAREGVDNSLFRDRFVSSSSGSNRQVNRQQPQALAAQTPHPFNLSHLRAALSDPAAQAHGQGPVALPPHLQHQQQHDPRVFEQSWGGAGVRSPSALSARAGSPGTPGLVAQHSGQNWAEGFNPQAHGGKGKGRAVEHAYTPTSPPVSQVQAHQPAYGGYGGYTPSMMGYQSTFQPMYSGYNGAGGSMMSSAQVQAGGVSAEEQARMHEVQTREMESAFDKAMADWKVQQGEEVQEGMGEQEAETVLDKGKEKEAEVAEGDGIEDRGEAKGELDKIWESLKPEAERLNQLAEWERDFSQFTNDEDDLFETLNNSLNRFDVGQTGLEDQMHLEPGYNPYADSSDLFEQTAESSTSQDQFDIRMPGQERLSYQFTLPNSFDALAPGAAWDEANRLLDSGGSLADATLLLETYIRRGTETDFSRPDASRLDAWSLLGRTHAMNEKEEKALSAYEEGRASIQGHESSPVIGEMLTNLAISHVNESSDLAALQVLHQFLAIAHPASAGPEVTAARMAERANPWQVHQDMADLFLELAREQYTNKGQVDPDVQVGLGTLYYMMGEYGEARDCWVAALGERPSDYLLWNRLGATLANGGSPEEAVDAYRRALELKPLFTRAIFNLGVACLNIGVHREAAEHFLAALSLHANASEKDQRDSVPLWLTLRRALISMDMLELSAQARPGTDLEVFRRAGFDF